MAELRAGERFELLLAVLHEARGLDGEASELGPQGAHVDAHRIASQAPAALDEGVPLDGATPVDVDEPEQAPSVVGVDPRGEQPRMPPLVGQACLQLTEGDHPRAVGAGVVEHRPQVRLVRLLVVQHRRGDRLGTPQPRQDGRVAENARDAVQDREVHETDEAGEKTSHHWRHLPQGLRGVPPTDAARNALEKREHRGVQRCPVVLQTRYNSWMEAIVFEEAGDDLNNKHSDHVDDQEQQYHRPHQGLQTDGDGVHDSPERRHKGDDAMDAEGTDQPSDLHDTGEAQLSDPSN
mmetsp:Transcript_78647/g.225353  ORF Transcript_78647/g.225353 Transcript_78647/m.225353 type:complete len:293 (-) Transcript_78647:513-1391(-)